MHGHHQHGRWQQPEQAAARGAAAFGPWPGFGPMGGGPRGGFGPGPRRRGGGFGGRARRGDVRAAILALLAERPMHGYEIISELAARTNGIWRPSPGSVYPTLQMLEDEGLVTSVEDDGKRRFSLTDDGRSAVAAREGRAPWEEFGEGIDAEAAKLRDAAFQLAAAVTQVAHAGNSAQRAEVATILDEARRRVYALLAEAPGETK